MAFTAPQKIASSGPCAFIADRHIMASIVLPKLTRRPNEAETTPTSFLARLCLEHDTKACTHADHLLYKYTYAANNHFELWSYRVRVRG